MTIKVAPIEMLYECLGVEYVAHVDRPQTTLSYAFVARYVCSKVLIMICCQGSKIQLMLKRTHYQPRPKFDT